MAPLLGMSESQGKDLIAVKPSDVEEKSEVHRKIQQYIGRRYEVYLTDGRIIRGTMLATDKDANMVFNQADERWTQSPAPGTRYLGQAMISKKYVSAMILMPEPRPVNVEPINVEAEGVANEDVEEKKAGEKKESDEGVEETKETKI